MIEVKVRPLKNNPIPVSGVPLVGLWSPTKYLSLGVAMTMNSIPSVKPNKTIKTQHRNIISQQIPYHATQWHIRGDWWTKYTLRYYLATADRPLGSIWYRTYTIRDRCLLYITKLHWRISTCWHPRIDNADSDKSNSCSVCWEWERGREKDGANELQIFNHPPTKYPKHSNLLIRRHIPPIQYTQSTNATTQTVQFHIRKNWLCNS